MSRKFAKGMALLVAGCIALMMCVGCGQDTDQDSPGNSDGAGATTTEAASQAPLVIGTLATEDILPMWVAEEESLFAQCGLDDVQIQVFQSATELIAGVTSGEVDIAMTDPMVTASIHASGTEVQIEWVTLGMTAEQGRFGIMTADPDITELTDLAGVPIGVGSNTILEYVMDKLMLAAGVAQEDIVKEEMQKLPVRYEAMASGQVAAAALPGSLLALGEANGCIVVADDTTGENISQSVMIARCEYVADESGTASVECARQAWDAAVEKINADPETYRALLVEKANLSDAVADTYPISEYPTSQLPTAEMIDSVLEWMQQKGYLSVELAYDAESGTFSVL